MICKQGANNGHPFQRKKSEHREDFTYSTAISSEFLFVLLVNIKVPFRLLLHPCALIIYPDCINSYFVLDL